MSYHNKTKPKEHKEIFGCDGYIYYFDCGDGFTDKCICPNSSNCINMCSFVYHLHLNKAVQKKKRSIELSEPQPCQMPPSNSEKNFLTILKMGVPSLVRYGFSPGPWNNLPQEIEVLSPRQHPRWRLCHVTHKPPPFWEGAGKQWSGKIFNKWKDELFLSFAFYVCMPCSKQRQNCECMKSRKVWHFCSFENVKK